MNDQDGEPCYLFGGAAYALSPWIMAPYKGNLTQRERKFNKAYSKVRVSVEWGFGHIVSLWPFLDSPKQQQTLLSSSGLGKQFIVGGILKNCHSCFYRNVSSSRFDVRPPSIDEYLNGEG